MQALHASARTSNTAGTLDVVRETGPLSLDLFFPVVTEEEMVMILTDTKNAMIKQYTKLFSMEGVRLSVTKDALKALATIDLSAVAKLPRGCQPCLSGVPFHIHEEFDPVINVALGH